MDIGTNIAWWLSVSWLKWFSDALKFNHLRRSGHTQLISLYLYLHKYIKSETIYLYKIWFVLILFLFEVFLLNHYILIFWFVFNFLAFCLWQMFLMLFVQLQDLVNLQYTMTNTVEIGAVHLLFTILLDL